MGRPPRDEQRNVRIRKLSRSVSSSRSHSECNSARDDNNKTIESPEQQEIKISKINVDIAKGEVSKPDYKKQRDELLGILIRVKKAFKKFK